MNVLLLGEYSGVHNNLSKALKKKGIDVLLISNGDGYKSLNSDIYIKYNYVTNKNKFLKKLINIYYILLMYSGLKGCIQILKYIKVIRRLKGYDIVQLINPLYLSDYGTVVNLIIFIYLKNNNNKIFLSALGDDYYWIKCCLNHELKYSFIDRLSIKNIKSFSYPLHYVYGLFNPLLNKYIVENVNAIIPGLYDYYIAYMHMEKCTEIVPIIMPVEEREIVIFKDFPIKIFHGWQIGKDLRKGNDIFDNAIRRIELDYPNKVDYKVVGGISYDTYIKMFKESHIFIDQCYSQDMGVNALLGMKGGKVVLSGFEKEVKEYYGIQYEPIINSIPDENQIYNNLKDIILNPNKMKIYSNNAFNFVKDYHNAEYVLEKYIKIWGKY